MKFVPTIHYFQVSVWWIQFVSGDREGKDKILALLKSVAKLSLIFQ